MLPDSDVTYLSMADVIVDFDSNNKYNFMTYNRIQYD